MRRYIVYFLFIYFTVNIRFCKAQENNDKKTDINLPVILTDNVSAISDSENDITSRENNLVSSELEPSVTIEHPTETKDLNSADSVEVFSDSVLQDSGILNEIINNDTPVVLPLTDTATAELHKLADAHSLVTDQKENSYTKNESTLSESQENTTVVDSSRSDLNLGTIQTDKVEIDVPIISKNLTDVKNEEIPSFSEWAQKHLEEAEKKEQVNSSIQSQNGKQGTGGKLRWKNYASLDCGAKVVLANPEAGSPWAVLSPSKDEYILNTCTSRIWFIVELCEAIQVKKIDLANYELFSSSPKDVVVSVSDRFPTRDWSVVGQFIAKDERDVQSFEFNHQIFGKYVKVEVKSHYGSEHYCPLSLFRAYGTSVFEVLQKEDPAHVQRVEDDDDDDESLVTMDGNQPKNIFSSATDAVINIVKKAAEVLGNKGNSTDKIQKSNEGLRFLPYLNSCITPSHNVICTNCSEDIFEKIYQLLSCKAAQIKNLVNIPFISRVLINSLICDHYGMRLSNQDKGFQENRTSISLRSFFPPIYIGAMCNAVAVTLGKASLNDTRQYVNVSEPVPNLDSLVNIKQKESHIKTLNDMDLNGDTIVETLELAPAEPLVMESLDGMPKASCSTDISYAAQIKPTKTSTPDQNLNKPVTETNTKLSTESVSEEFKTDDFSVKVETGDVDNEQIEMNKASSPDTKTPSEIVEDHLDNLISEFNEDNPPTTTSSSPSAPATPPGQKESVFLRLSNRIRALERNMSLSSQYLEELSKRYKKQVEEMQRLLEKTVVTLYEESVKKEERYKQLEERLENLTFAVENMLAERSKWWAAFYWLFFVVFFVFVVYTFCNKPATHKHTLGTQETSQVQRRKSIDIVTQKTSQKKKRRPSDQALKIVASSTMTSDKQRKRKKKVSLVSRSNSVNTVGDGNYMQTFAPRCTSSRIYTHKNRDMGDDWVGNHQGIEDIPFVLEDSEHTSLEAIGPTKENKKIDSPLFLKTAMAVRSNRNSLNGASHFVQRNKSPIGNGKASNCIDPEQTPKKEKKGFKKLFRKVFE